MKTRLFISSIIAFLFYAPFTQAQTGIYEEWTGFNPDSKVAIYQEISDALEINYPHESEAYRVLKMRWISYKLDNLLLAAPHNGTGCSQGTFSKTTVFSNLNTTKVSFIWDILVPNVDEYFAYHLDLNSFSPEPVDQSNIVSTSEISTNDLPTTSLVFNTAGLHLFAINTRCSNSQSDYTIIIVEKVITAPSNWQVDSDYFPSEDPQVRLTDSNKNISLEIVPNIVQNADIQINLELDETQYVSLQLFDASSGRLVKTILQRQEVAKGYRKNILKTDGLSSGMYFLVLQTNNKRIVKKFIKV